MKKLLSSLALGLSALCATVTAHADNAASCPADALQTLYETANSVQSAPDANRAAGEARLTWALTACKDQMSVQGMAAWLGDRLFRSTQDVDKRKTYLTQMQTAIGQTELSWKSGQTTPKITKADGSQESFYGYNVAANVLEDTLIPGAVYMAQHGNVHPLIDDEHLDFCPYGEVRSTLFDEEVKVWEKGLRKYYGEPVFDWATNRLLGLRNACPAFHRWTTYEAGQHLMDGIRKLRGWTAQSKSYGRIFWTSPADEKTYYKQDEYDPVKQRYDALANAHEVKLRALIADIQSWPEEGLTSDEKNWRQWAEGWIRELDEPAK